MSTKELPDVLWDIFHSSLEENAIYLILDGARFANMYVFLGEQNRWENYIPLFRGTFYQTVEIAGPFLLSVHKNDSIFQWFMQLPENSLCGILLKTSIHMEELKEHLQNWLEVTLPDYNLALFRYYDPVVVHKIFGTMSEEELLALFGPIEAWGWYAEADSPNGAWHCLRRSELHGGRNGQF